MAILTKEIYNWGRSFPAPFSILPKKSTVYYSVYGKATSGRTIGSTLCAPMIKAILAAIKMETAVGCGGYGCNDRYDVAEYASSTGNTHVFAYNRSTGAVEAIIKDRDLGVLTSYPLSDHSAEDSSAFFLCLMTEFRKDAEFEENFVKLKEALNDEDEAGYTTAYILCDNIYRRIENGNIPVNIKKQDGGYTKIKNFDIDAGIYTPDNSIVGEFTVLGTIKGTATTMKKQGISHEKFEGAYNPDPERELTPELEELVPVLKESDIVDKQAVEVCQIIKETDQRNFMFVGPAGSGKSTMTRVVSSGIHRPFYLMCLNAGTTAEDLLGFIRMELKDEVDEKKAYEDASMVAEKIIAGEKVTLDDIVYSPEEIYEEVFGTPLTTDVAKDEHLSSNIFEQLVKNVVAKVVTNLENKNSDNRRFIYQDTPLVQAIRNGGVVEIQEPTVVVQQGVLVALNSLLEEGIINLPNGEVIRRHPDCVIIMTTNLDYNGCRGMNQSFVDRCVPIMCPAPTKEAMVARVMAKTGVDDKELIDKMADVTVRMKKYCDERGITEGEVGYRALERWVTLNKVLNDPYKTALMSIVPAASLNPADQVEVASAVVEPVFAKY